MSNTLNTIFSAALREQPSNGLNGRAHNSQLDSMQEELHQQAAAKDSLAAELQDVREQLQVTDFTIVNQYKFWDKPSSLCDSMQGVTSLQIGCYNLAALFQCSQILALESLKALQLGHSLET